MNIVTRSSRRELIRRNGLVIATASSFGAMSYLFAAEKEEEEVSPSEDLMREHGVLKRVLLVYGEAIRRIDANEDLPPESVVDAAKIIRDFIEDYHEKLEENFLLPRFEKAGKLVDLVTVLREQHQAGRRVTDLTMSLANLRALKDAEDRRKLAELDAGLSLRAFRMAAGPASPLSSL